MTPRILSALKDTQTFLGVLWVACVGHMSRSIQNGTVMQ